MWRVAVPEDGPTGTVVYPLHADARLSVRLAVEADPIDTYTGFIHYDGCRLTTDTWQEARQLVSSSTSMN